MDDFNKNMFEEENTSEPASTSEIPQQPINPYNTPINQQEPPQNPYNQNNNPFAQQAAAYAGPKPSTGMATASMVLGIISVVIGIFMLMLPPLLLLPIIGLILGIVHKTKHIPEGKGASTAGIVTSAIALGFCILLIIFAVVIVMNSADFMYETLETLKTTNPDLYETYYDMLYDSYPEWFDGAIKMLSCFFMK